MTTRPIANKYREGKLKSTLNRELNSTWNRLGVKPDEPEYLKWEIHYFLVVSFETNNDMHFSQCKTLRSICISVWMVYQMARMVCSFLSVAFYVIWLMPYRWPGKQQIVFKNHATTFYVYHGLCTVSVCECSDSMYLIGNAIDWGYLQDPSWNTDQEV